MTTTALGLGHQTNLEFFASEFGTLDLGDKRLNRRAGVIFEALQKNLTTCIRRLFINPKEARQAYDFF